MRQLAEKWRNADGEMGIVIEDSLFYALVQDPPVFCKVMAGDSELFVRFVENLDNVFVDYSNGNAIEGLERMRLDALGKLGAAHVDKRYQWMMEMALDKLEAVAPESD